MTNINPPCKDCITLAICKGIKTGYADTMKGIFISTLESRCSIIAAYTKGRYANPKNNEWEFDTTADVLDFFYKEGKYEPSM